MSKFSHDAAADDARARKPFLAKKENPVFVFEDVVLPENVRSSKLPLHKI